MRTRPHITTAFLLFALLLTGCGGDQGAWMPAWSPDGKTDGLDGLTLFEDQLGFGEAVTSAFTEDEELHGWTFTVGPDAPVSLEITHKGTSTKVDTTLFLHGPKRANGSWPTDPVAWDDDSGWGRHAEIEDVPLSNGGEYLAVVATHDGQGRGHYRLDLRCHAQDPSVCAAGPADTCLGRCGEYSQTTCSCNTSCVRYGDCCADYAAACDFRATDIHRSWLEWLAPELVTDTFIDLMIYLTEQYEDNDVYPPKEQVFNALIYSPLEKVKVVILGQDPYHGPGEAHGFSFSVPGGIAIPPSLRNILKEVASDIEGIDTASNAFSYPDSGNLIPWADQGVLMLNTVLTVRDSEANSHKNMGWEPFTERVISIISEKQENVVFMLWGSKARAKASLIDSDRHLILEASHPSPLTTGFLGCRHFSQANDYLEANGRDPIDWYDSIW